MKHAYQGDNASLTQMLGRAVLAGIAGSVVMTAFQKLVEMPITKREDSYAPAQLAQRLLPIEPKNDKERWRLNYAAHTSLGAMWGAAYGVAAYKGLRGMPAIAVTFAAIYTSDVVNITLLGLAKPWKWSRQEWVIDLVDKFVQVLATSVIFDHLLDPERPS
ncbi:hypothetical protein [Deinococcus peraridilitoris]|uniref:Periplasmic/secreted protein n=1 Tax=Deinococcus peraridilitoris (strain DSM 19664 / LMG 22246 / CIP 109416 / KR-200) TaxID=937777 RepID=L0A7D7_DEIPD|nr:hypothetical protein [Deinococcus peraridilitoris]AFZ69726.1 hypothetical protein Deipe_4390 [Deinococcus peraridilitoris DSM 19664]